MPNDPDPALIGPPPRQLEGAHSRVLRPAVRASYLRDGPRRSDNRRGQEPFVEVSWKDAHELVAREIVRVREEHGSSAIYGGSYGWASAGRLHHSQSQVHRFLAVAGGYTRSVNTYSMAAAEVMLPHVLGQSAREHFATFPTMRVLAETTDLVVSFGGLPRRNTQVNAGGVARHTVADGYRACVDSGVDMVNIGPVGPGGDAQNADEGSWLAIRPGTDTAVMLAMAHTIVDAGLHDASFLDSHCVGFEELRAYLLGSSDGVPKDAQWAESISGMPAATLRALATQIAEKRSFLTMTWSLQRADHGEQPVWMLAALAAIAGCIGRTGQGCAVGYLCEHNQGGGSWRPRAGAFPQVPNAVADFIPVARIADALLDPGTEIDYNCSRLTLPFIDLVYWAGGNPFHHHQDLNRLRRAWQEPSTIVVNEPYWTYTAKMADIVLPATVPLEREDFAVGDRDPFITAMHRIEPPLAMARDDYDIFCGIAGALGVEQEFSMGRSAREWLEMLYAETAVHVGAGMHELPPFEDFWERGQVALDDGADPGSGIWPLSEFRADPSTYPLKTPSGKIELFSERLAVAGYADCRAHPSWLEPREWIGSRQARQFPLHLISDQPKRRLHSQNDFGSASKSSKVAGREPIRMHPDDAAARGVVDGDVVRVFNDRGACLAGVQLVPEVMPGVVLLATGSWYDPSDPGDPHTLEIHGNPNVLTADVGTSSMAQGPSAQSALVEIELYVADLPPIRAFDPPQFVTSTAAPAGTADEGDMAQRGRP